MYRVSSCVDPYLNTDAGTISPFEHGEVFVLDDGGEVTLLKLSNQFSTFYAITKFACICLSIDDL